jgi:hypothetical protein
MKRSESKKILVLVVIGICLALFAMLVYIMPGDPFTRSKVYTETMGNFSFQLPESFDITRQQAGEDQAYLKITAPNDQNQANPGLVEITVFQKDPNTSLVDHASTFLSVSPDKLVNVPSNKETLYYNSVSGQISSQYYIYENQNNIIAFKFNRTYFDKSNPMMLVDNSAYANIFLGTLGTLRFQ